MFCLLCTCGSNFHIIQKINLKNKGTGKYLRIKKNGDVDVAGNGGGWTVFEVEVVQEPNVVKLKSAKFGNYISVKPNGKVNKGIGGKHCVLTFYRDGGNGQKQQGGGGGHAAVAQAQAAAQQPPRAKPAKNKNNDDDNKSDSDYDNYDADKDKDAEDVKVPEPPKPLGEDAEAVKKWLETIGHDGYIDAFIEAGYDKMDTVAMIDIKDLEGMSVKPGHRKELMIGM